MKKTIYCHYGSDNHTVVDFYVDIIIEAVKRLGYNVEIVTYADAHTMDKSTYIIDIAPISILRWRMKGFKNFILWSQGILPEESALRHNGSRTRYIVCGFLEKLALKIARFQFFVSHAMKEHYENKYNLNFGNNFYIMPCYNCEIEKESFFTPRKYENNIFTYVGSLAAWQCFEETAVIYKQIEDRLGNTEFLVCTPDVEKAKIILDKLQVKNSSVQFVKQQQLSEILKKCKFGFIIREDCPINNVATPTKLSTYMSNGIIPIVSNCIHEYDCFFKDYKYVVSVEDKVDLADIEILSQESIDPESIYNEFKRFYNAYYNSEEHIKAICNKLRLTL